MDVGSGDTMLIFMLEFLNTTSKPRFQKTSNLGLK
jgi:hypothetical protein